MRKRKLKKFLVVRSVFVFVQACLGVYMGVRFCLCVVLVCERERLLV